MREWLKANGGPPALVLAGLGLISLNLYIGVTMAAIGALLWVYRASWFPLIVVKKKDVVAKKSDQEVVLQAREVVGSLGALFGQHVRYKPAFHSEDEKDMGSYASWAKGVNRSNSHDQSTAARFFEDHYENLTRVVAALHSRGALSQDEVQRVNWWIGTAAHGGGLTHQLTEIPPLITKAADRLESGDVNSDV